MGVTQVLEDEEGLSDVVPADELRDERRLEGRVEPVLRAYQQTLTGNCW